MSSVSSGPAPAARPQHDIESICAAYCPPLEAGLVYAIASDFDLSDPKAVKDLQDTLNELRGSAVIEQDLELLPQVDHFVDQPTSAHAVRRDLPNSQHGNESSVVSKSSPQSTTEDDGVTSVTTGFSGLKFSDVDGNEFDDRSGYGDASVDFETLSEDEKFNRLNSMFPGVKIQDVKEVLARCNGNFDRSTDELLNISFLKELSEDHGNQEYVAPKGIDGFLQPDVSSSQRKPKGKGRRNKTRADHKDFSEPWASDSAMSSGAATPNVWKDLPEDVEFIASRTRLRPKVITSIYHANCARLAPTIRALAIKEGETYTKTPHKVDEIMEWQMDELRTEFTHVSDAQIYGILMLTNNIPSAAKELLDAMIMSNEAPVLLGKVTGLASYTPINLSDDDTKPRIKKSPATLWSSTFPADTIPYTTTHVANPHGQAATQAFSQASAAYRRGRSDHLMSGAAAYYAGVGHERIKAAKSMQAAAADAHVASQSSSTSMDLHGVNVADAVRIAQRGVEAWWEGLGDRKYIVGGKGNGYRVVTGVGKHSADGVGRIGPAVSRMLVREGWKVEVGRGEIVVLGRARR